MTKNQGGLGEAAVQGGGGDLFPYHNCSDYHYQEGQKPGEDAKVSFFFDVFCQRLLELEQIKEPEKSAAHIDIQIPFHNCHEFMYLPRAMAKLLM